MRLYTSRGQGACSCCLKLGPGTGLVLVDACEDQRDNSESPVLYPALLAQVQLLSHMIWVLKASSFSLADHPERAWTHPL